MTVSGLPGVHVRDLAKLRRNFLELIGGSGAMADEVRCTAAGAPATRARGLDGGRWRLATNWATSLRTTGKPQEFALAALENCGFAVFLTSANRT